MTLHKENPDVARLASMKTRRARLLRFLRAKVWPSVPKEQLGRRLTKAEEDALLGYGPGGV
jgi:antitoxin VapB